MKCRETQYWLYSFQPNAAWPADVVGHLQQCRACQQLQAQLRQIDQEVNQLTSLPRNTAPVAHLLQSIARTPQTSAPTETQPKEPLPSPSAPRKPWLRWAAYLTAMAALVAFGWLLGRPWGENVRTVEVVREKNIDVFRDKIVTVQSHADRNLVTSLLKRNAQLLRATQVTDRLQTLLAMADDCGKHAVTLIEKGPYDYLPMTIDLYAQLLREGVLVQLSQVPLTKRAPLEGAVRARLQEMARAVERVPALPRPLEDQRGLLENATRQTLDLVDKFDENPAALKPRKWRPDNSAPPALALVRYAIAVSSEPDAVAKASQCNECVRHLMPYIMLYLADESAPKRAEMGEQFGEMIHAGIYAPLQSASVNEASAPVKAKADLIFQQTTQTIDQMKKHMETAPAPARAALEKAVQASKKGWEKNRNKGKSKSKGKSKGKGGASNRNGSDGGDRRSSRRGKDPIDFADAALAMWPRLLPSTRHQSL